MKGDQHQNVNGKSGRSERVLARGLCGPRQQRLSFLPDPAPEFARWLGSGEGGALVRREKGAYIQWEEDIPPGNLRSSRKQSRQRDRVTRPLKPLMEKVREKRISERSDHNEN